ncbi:MAG: hypothetical protein AMXMBFR45_24320 [Gammaproteobacteria bacterium]
MRRFIALLVAVSFTLVGFDYVTDYAEAFEGTPLAFLPDGHAEGDGHDAAEHVRACNGCHLGGALLLGLTHTISVVQDLERQVLADRPAHPLGSLSPSRLNRPPIA